MKGFTLSTGAPDAPLHAAAHSHHPWPDVTLAAQEQAWKDAVRLLDRKWDHIFGSVIPSAQAHIARQLSLPDPATIAFGPNTHSFVLRLLSCLPEGRPPRILTTDSEFMSFTRQIARLEEDRLAEVTRIAVAPFDTFEERFASEAARGKFDLVYFSQVFFNSGYAIGDLPSLVRAAPDPETFVVIDGYHGFMALPTNLSSLAARVFYVAGGYKYAMAGEGVCFLHCPPGYGARPRDTGWYAGFGALESGARGVPFAPDGSRFFGATFDVSGLYRFNAVQDWLAREGMDVGSMLRHVRSCEAALLEALDRGGGAIDSSMLVVRNQAVRGRFLAFETPDAAALTAKLAAQNIIVDHRGTRLRIGLGIYHDGDSVRRLATTLGATGNRT